MNEFDASAAGSNASDGVLGQGSRVYLYCIRHTVRLAAVLESPELMAVLVEDTCLRIAVLDWCGRLPSRLHRRARIRWDAEGAYLRREEQRLADLADLAIAETPQARPEVC